MGKQKRLDRPCPSCLGTGYTTFNTEKGWHNKCPTCKGTGKVEEMDRPALREDKELFSVIFTTLPKYVHALLDKKVSEETVSKEILRGVSKQEAIARELYKDVQALFDTELEAARSEEKERIIALLDAKIGEYMGEHGVKMGYGLAYKALSELRQSLKGEPKTGTLCLGSNRIKHQKETGGN